MTVTVCGLPITEGAVYTPSTIVPTGGFSDQLIAVLPEPAIAAEKLAEPPAPSEAVAGVTVTPPATAATAGISSRAALAVFTGFAALMAKTLTGVGEATDTGAVYSPFAMLPMAGETDQATRSSLLPFITAKSCLDCPANKTMFGGEIENDIGGGVAGASVTCAKYHPREPCGNA